MHYDARDSKGKNKYFYEELNLLRGIAIFLIVFNHFNCALMGAGDWTTSWYYVWASLWVAGLWGGSWFFVFISGFLFHAIFYQRGIVYKNFILQKCKKVFCPYFIFASILLIIRFIVNRPETITSNYLIGAYFYWSFWYVPFIMCIFLMTPGFELFIKLPSYSRILIFIISLSIAIGVGRHNSNPILSCVYFIPGYLLGIIASIYYEKIIDANINLRWTLFFISIMYIICLVASGCVGEPTFSTWTLKFWQQPSYTIIVKLSFCFFFMWVLRFFILNSLKILIKPLNLLAKYSFTIFFFHQYPLFYFEKFPHKEFFDSLAFWPRMGVQFFGSLALCFMIILIFAPLKKILGKYSRMIIGC